MRDFINLVEEAHTWPATMSAKELLKLAKEWHTPEDGDYSQLSHDILSYKVYHLKRVPLDHLTLDNFTLDDDKVDAYAGRTDEAPPIIVGQWGMILDGNHRANAAEKRGDEDILAYVYEPQKVSEDADEVPPLPPVLYHGTTPYNAALIVLSGIIEQNESRDEDDHDSYSVCTTERADVAEWFYDVARAVDQPFGFVFHIDTSKIRDHMRPFEAETAGKPEYEWRIYGDIHLTAVTKITLAGYKGTTEEDMREYVEDMERRYPYEHRFDEEEIVEAIMALIKKASK